MGQTNATPDFAGSTSGGDCCTSRTSTSGSPRSGEVSVAPAWLFPQFQHSQQQQQQQQQHHPEQKVTSSTSHCCGARGGKTEAFGAPHTPLLDNDKDQGVLRAKEKVNTTSSKEDDPGQGSPQQPQQQRQDPEANKDRAWTSENGSIPKLLQPRVLRGDSGGANSGSKRVPPAFCNLDCVAERNGGLSEVLNGDRVLTRKLVSLQALREEESQLTQALSLIDTRLEPSNQSGKGESTSRLSSLSLRSNSSTESRSSSAEAAVLRGLPASLVAEAYRTVAPQLLKQVTLEIEEDLKHPTPPSARATLEAARRIAENRLRDVREEVGRLTCESEELEDFISSIFEDLGTDDEGHVTLESFEASLCCDGDEHESMFPVSPEDAEKAFLQMTKGGQVLSYEQFKEESTIGLLHVLHRNLSARRNLRKRFRDYWF